MAKKYTSQEILDMAVGLIEKDLAADNDGDGNITAADARYQKRLDSGLLPLDNVSLMAESIVNKIIRDTDSYSYDVNSDRLYNEYKKMYGEMGDRAAEDAMGLASALTGGYGNSYALSQASREREKYNDKLSERAMELEKEAYSRHNDSLSSLYSLYELLTDAEKRQEEKEKAALDFALSAASKGDSSYLKELGIQPDETEELIKRAELFAKYKDYSLLKELGVDLSALDKEELMELGEYYAKYGDYSILESLGVDTSDRELMQYYELLEKKLKVR